MWPGGGIKNDDEDVREEDEGTEEVRLCRSPLKGGGFRESPTENQ